MFDIGFWELAVIAVVGLLIIGPEKLPDFTRDIVNLTRKIKRFIRNTKRDLESQLNVDESRQFMDSLSDMDNILRDAPDKQEGFKPLSKGGEGKAKPSANSDYTDNNEPG